MITQKLPMCADSNVDDQYFTLISRSCKVILLKTCFPNPNKDFCFVHQLDHANYKLVDVWLEQVTNSIPG